MMTARLTVCLTLFLLAPALAGGGDGMTQVLDPGAEVAPTQSATAVVVRKPKLRAEASVEIAAPADEVWAYLSDNAKAREWSVYFHHITTLDPEAHTRRCYVNADESGKRWDERVVGEVPSRVRHIDMYAMVDYKVPGSHHYHYDVYQLLEPLGPNRTRLTFRSAPAKGSGLTQHLIWLGARRKTSEVFAQNLANIAAAIEEGAAYQRRFAYPYPH